MFLASILSFFIPLAIVVLHYFIFSLFLFRGELSRKIRLGAIAWGCVGAILISLLFQMSLSPVAERMYVDASVRGVFEGGLVGPFIEECSKGLFPLVAWMWFGLKGKRALFVLGALSGSGFFLFEGTISLIGALVSETPRESWTFELSARILFLGFSHSFWTSFVGLGIGFASRFASKLLQFISIAIGLFLGFLHHAALNTLAFAINDGHKEEGWMLVERIYLATCLLQILMLISFRIVRRIRKRKQEL